MGLITQNPNLNLNLSCRSRVSVDAKYFFTEAATRLRRRIIKIRQFARMNPAVFKNESQMNLISQLLSSNFSDDPFRWLFPRLYFPDNRLPREVEGVQSRASCRV